MAKGTQHKRRGQQQDVRKAPPVVDLDTKHEDGVELPAPVQIELFKFEGITYYMEEPAANLLLKVMKAARERGEMGAVGFLLEELIGEKAFEVLMGIDDLKPEELDGVIERVMHFSMGKLEALGN
jgi:hypothetical protein